MEEQQEIIREFLTGSGANLTQLDQYFVEFEQHPNATKLLQRASRTIQTIEQRRFDRVAAHLGATLDALGIDAGLRDKTPSWNERGNSEKGNRPCRGQRDVGSAKDGCEKQAPLSTLSADCCGARRWTERSMGVSRRAHPRATSRVVTPTYDGSPHRRRRGATPIDKALVIDDIPNSDSNRLMP